jgi:pimeloyl-ACP methyl ester carboxylesterase
MIGPYERRTLLQALALSTLTPTFIPRAVAADEGKNTQNELTHRMVALIGIRFHIAEQGQGPLVLLCHGWPECWYSWRHQLRALADAGFHAVAPDMRGFGQTDAPEDISAYTIVHHVGDMVQLVSTLGKKQAVIIGHDWGAFVAWACAHRLSALVVNQHVSQRFATRQAASMGNQDALFAELHNQPPSIADQIPVASKVLRWPYRNDSTFRVE